MGIIQKQALRTTIVTFAGIAIGILSRAIMPFVLEKDQIGALNMLDSASLLIAAVSTLGFTQITLRVFPNFRDDENGHSGFLLLGLFFSLIGILVGELSFYFLKDFILGRGLGHKTIQSVSYLIFPIIFFRILFMNSDIYLRMLSKSVLGAFWEGFVLKLVVISGVLLFWLSWIDFEYLSYIYTAAFCLPGLVLVFLSFNSTKKITRPKKTLLTKENKRAMLTYGAFGIIGVASGTLIKTVDNLMVNKLLGEEKLGVYAVLFLGGILVSVPARGIRRIAVPLLSEAWKNNDLKNISTTYSKSAINQLIVGFYLLIVGWACIEEVLTFLPDYQEGLYVFLFIGVAQLLDMMTGVNMEVIATSEKYKMNTYFNIALVGLTIGFNFWFIALWGLPGAAFASALSVLIINIIRWFYLKKTYQLQPFNGAFVKAFLFGLLLLITVSFIQLDLNPILSILIQFAIITAIYWSVVVQMKWSLDINNWLLKMKTKFWK